MDGNIYQIRSDNVVAMEFYKEDGTYTYSSDPNFINGLGYFGQVELVSDTDSINLLYDCLRKQRPSLLWVLECKD